MMANDLRNFRQFPVTVRRATFLLFSGWVLFYFFYYYILEGRGFSIQQTLVGVLCCLCFLTFRNWARVLAVLCNIMFVLQFIPLSFAFLSADRMVPAVLTGIMVLLFASATYYLLVRESADFFKTFHTPTNSSK